MELKQLEYFTIVCEKGSFSQAAECLYTSQPNVSKVISSLEKELGRKLEVGTERKGERLKYGKRMKSTKCVREKKKVGRVWKVEEGG